MIIFLLVTWGKKSLHQYLGYLAMCLCKILLLGFLQELGSSSNRQNNAVCHPVVMEAKLHSTLEVPGEQGLCDEPVHIWQGNPNTLFHNHHTLQMV